MPAAAVGKKYPSILPSPDVRTSPSKPLRPFQKQDVDQAETAWLNKTTCSDEALGIYDSATFYVFYVASPACWREPPLFSSSEPSTQVLHHYLLMLLES